MKKQLFFLLLFAVCSVLGAEAVENYLDTPTKLSFNGTDYELGWSSHPRDYQYLQEYFPEGQTPENFTEMLSIWMLVGDFPANVWIQNLAASYNERKQWDLCCNFQMYENGGEHMLDCILGESADNEMKLVEFNIYRCKNIFVGGHPAIIICFFTCQGKDEDITPFLMALREDRMKYLVAMANFEFPEVSIR